MIAFGLLSSNLIMETLISCSSPNSSSDSSKGRFRSTIQFSRKALKSFREGIPSDCSPERCKRRMNRELDRLPTRSENTIKANACEYPVIGPNVENNTTQDIGCRTEAAHNLAYSLKEVELKTINRKMRVAEKPKKQSQVCHCCPNNIDNIKPIAMKKIQAPQQNAERAEVLLGLYIKSCPMIRGLIARSKAKVRVKREKPSATPTNSPFGNEKKVIA